MHERSRETSFLSLFSFLHSELDYYELSDLGLIDRAHPDSLSSVTRPFLYPSQWQTFESNLISLFRSGEKDWLRMESRPEDPFKFLSVNWRFLRCQDYDMNDGHGQTAMTNHFRGQSYTFECFTLFCILLPYVEFSLADTGGWLQEKTKVRIQTLLFLNSISAMFGVCKNKFILSACEEINQNHSKYCVLGFLIARKECFWIVEVYQCYSQSSCGGDPKKMTMCEGHEDVTMARKEKTFVHALTLILRCARLETEWSTEPISHVLQCSSCLYLCPFALLLFLESCVLARTAWAPTSNLLARELRGYSDCSITKGEFAETLRMLDAV